MICPLRRRFILPPSNALSLLRNNATSICSRLTLSGLYSPAILDKVSPRLTVYVPPTGAVPGVAVVPGVVPADSTGRAAGRPERAGGDAASARGGRTGSAAACISAVPGGSSRNV